MIIYATVMWLGNGTSLTTNFTVAVVHNLTKAIIFFSYFVNIGLKVSFKFRDFALEIKNELLVRSYSIEMLIYVRGCSYEPIKVGDFWFQSAIQIIWL